MNRVKRAIIMAAGKGERMYPVTLYTPKPLVRVNGVRMIDTVIDALHKNGIYEIYIVVGYKQEHFLSLTQEYEGVVLIHNPYYETCNNISSLYMAREHLEDCIILDGDQIIYDPEVLSPEFERSGYNAVWTDRPTDEWLMTVNEEGIVTDCSRTGGSHLRKHLELEFEEKENRSIYWDDVAMFCHRDEYQLGIREMKPGEIVEIDDIAELAAKDPKYRVISNVV